MKKLLAVGVIVLFIGMVISSSTGFNLEKQSTVATLGGNTLYVGGSGPGNYSTIKEAVEDANNGDTVFVYNGTYVEYNIIIDKSINLVGEDRNLTIIDGNDNISDILWIVTGGVHVSGFTITNAGWDGIFLDPSDNSSIIGNNFISNGDDGIDINDSSISNYNIIQNNMIDSNNNNGIYFRGSSKHNIISSNIINDSLYGISLNDDCYDNTITGNLITNTSSGIVLNSHLTKIKNNNISNCGNGIEIRYCWGNTVSENRLKNNFIGALYSSSSYNNTISDNIFENNQLGLFFSGFPYNNTIVNNTFHNDGFFVLGETSGNIIQNNTINGKTIVYIENESDAIINEDAGQIILMYCRNITITGKNLSNASIAIQLIVSDDCHITGNTLKDNFFGLWIESSFNNIISENDICDNLYNGITLSSCFNTNISGNTITGNNNFTIYPWEYLFQEVFGHNSSAGIILLTSVDNTISENTVSLNTANGITCILSAKNTISRNHLELNNDTGLLLIGSVFNKIYQNSFIGNKDDAFFHTSFLNRWKGNYWSESRKLPKLIQGKIGRRINWYNIDLKPAQEPYNIYNI